jgi:methyl-accepting chemotaxis protein
LFLRLAGKRRKGEVMKGKSLQFKLLSGGIVIVLIPLLFIGLFTAWKSTKAIGDLAKGQSMLIAQGLADMLQIDMEEKLNIMRTTSSAISGYANDSDAVIKTLGKIHKNIGDNCELIVFMDPAGVVVADSVGGKQKGVSVAERPYFKEAKAGKANVGAVGISKASGQPFTAAAVPVYAEDGSLTGVLAGVIKITYLIDKLGKTKMGKTGYAYAIDRRGIMIAHPNKDFILSLNLLEDRDLKDLGASILSGKAGYAEYHFRGADKISGYATAPLMGWGVAFTQNYDELMAPALQIRNFIIIISAVFLLLTIGAVLILSRSISRPVANAIQEMDEAAQQVASASGQVAQASQGLAEGSSEQASALEETSASMEEMSSMTSQNAEHANHADNLIKETGKIVGRVNESMKKLNLAMKDVSAASEETSKIIKTIDEIAFQTNLLALNAAVEAARAGESGAGFAVVADEVRNLALRSAEAAKNTAVLIEQTVAKVKESSAFVDKTTGDFTELAASAGKVADLIGEISAASNEQAQGISQVGKAISEMDQVVQQNAATAEESASAAEEMNAQAENMKGITGRLSFLIAGRSFPQTSRGISRPGRDLHGLPQPVLPGSRH